ncbi:hypothetical protein ABTZ46_11300 [Nocardioides sp. NPDC126508]
MSIVLGLLYWAVYLCGWVAIRNSREAAAEDAWPRPTPWGVGLWCAVSLPSLLQIALPGMLVAGQRDPVALADGEWWRLVTSMGLQDGGLFGTVFNLITLAISVAIVGEVLPGPTMIVVFVSGGVIGNLLTLAILGGSGAGNSMATMFLVAAAAVVAAYGLRRLLAPAVVLVAAAVVLCVLHDQHGFAAAAGLVAGVGLGLVGREPVSP